MLLDLIAQTTTATTSGSASGWGGVGLGCCGLPVVVVGLLVGMYFLSSRLQQRQIRLDAAAAARGVHEEQERERLERERQQRP